MAEADIDHTKANAAKKMQSALEVLHKELGGLRTGRASVNMLEPLVVDAYGSEMPITQVATLNAPESRLLTVQVWDRGLTKAVEKAIQESGLGLNPQSEGSVIRVPIPALNEERRQELTKVAHRYAESARVAVRNVRRHALDELKKAEKSASVSQDQIHDLTKQVQAVTDEFIKKIDDAVSKKEVDILQV